MVYPGSGPSTPEVTPLLPSLFLIIFTVVTTLLELFGLEEEEEGSALPSLRVQTPLYTRGSGYRLAGRLPAPPRPRPWPDPLASDSLSDDGNFIKCLSSLDRHLGGICPPFCLGSFLGEGSCPLIGGVWMWLASCPSLASVDLVGARLLSAKQPLEGSCHLRRLRSPRWSRQPAAGAAGPLVGAGLLSAVEIPGTSAGR
jgi:hypothetical protein